MSPIVGISQCLDDRGRWRSGRDYLYIDHAYARAVEDAGGTPIHLPPQSDSAALVPHIDALLLPGGDDFLPPENAGYPADAFDPAPRSLIEFDTALLAAALASGLPVLGVCYGMQLIALHHGGALYHHLPVDKPGSADHQLPEQGGRHLLRVESGSRIEAILGAKPRVNSLHHQAVAEPGDGLLASAVAPDGVIEAIEAEGDAFVVGVQWHPEKLSDAEGRLPLFRALVEAAS